MPVSTDKLPNLLIIALVLCMSSGHMDENVIGSGGEDARGRHIGNMPCSMQVGEGASPTEGSALWLCNHYDTARLNVQPWTNDKVFGLHLRFRLKSCSLRTSIDL